ncbi:phytoene/squalene synthase family protein [Paenibacillus sp. y28]|uniref:phytoene/squalene synthase family protein n=1 Tax=Paenibacillus sp. y28 TaxID=3129110 RepID=UPI00301889C7
MTMLQQTSRTFYIPISRLTPGLKEAVSSAYLCMRAIDEIEDDADLAGTIKAELLQGVHDAIQAPDMAEAVQKVLSPYKDVLPEVTLRLHEWALLCPPTVAPTIYGYIARMSKQMAEWVNVGWNIKTEEELDGYTYSVAGMVGEMLSEIWLWYDGTTSDMTKAVAFGRGLQAVNILRNRTEDLERGVDFYPDGWGSKEMLHYTRRNLKLADEYIAELKEGPAMEFCKIPLALAHATVKLISAGGNKLTRDTVLKIVNRITG